MKALAKWFAITAAGATGIVAIWQAVALALPVARSDDPPWQGKAEAAILAQNYEQMQKTQQTTSETLAKINDSLDWTTLNFLQSELDRMEKERAPVSQRREVVDKINLIRQRLKLPPIPRP